MNLGRQPLRELMATLGMTKWPTRWEEIYDAVMDEYEQNGCVLTDPAYYEKLHATYGSLPHTLDDHKRAAVAMAKNEPLTRMLMLLCDTLAHRETADEEIASMDMPRPSDGSYKIEYEMLTALAMASTADYTHGLLVGYGLPKEQIDYTMQQNEKMVRTYKARHDGRSGAMSFSWYQLVVDAKIFGAGRMDLEIDVPFPKTAMVFENDLGERVALAQNRTFHREGYVLGCRGYTDEEGAFAPTIVESDDSYQGYAYDRYGLVRAENFCVLPKSEWRILLRPGDPMIGLHIPPGGGLTPELVEESLDKTEEFVATYFPKYDYRGFVCSSWLTNGTLLDILDEKSNVARFCARFDRLCQKTDGRSALSFVFLRPAEEQTDVDALPENTSLERALKRHYQSGANLHEMLGYIPHRKGEKRC